MSLPRQHRHLSATLATPVLVLTVLHVCTGRVTTRLWANSSEKYPELHTVA